MSEANSHISARDSIRWLQGYFKSLKAWIGEVDGVLGESQWLPFEPNRVSTALGNRYQDSTEWVLNWVTRHYYRAESNKTLLVYLPLATHKAKDEVDVFAYFMCCEHQSPPPEDGIPGYVRDWSLGAPVIEFLRIHSPGVALETDQDTLNKTFRNAVKLKVMKVAMVELGQDQDSARTAVAESWQKVMLP